MSANKWSTKWSTTFGGKSLSALVMFSILSSDIPSAFHDSIRVVPVKYLMYFIAGINTK